ncbi:MAG: TIGR02680 family protein, partial [Alicyclobacillus sp.]|nr:TIGR02680 family protein [Alicyclobacillus sp.]
GHTLADYLRPTPPPDSGLTLEQVDDALRTVVIADPRGAVDREEDGLQGEGRMVVGADGRYRIGPLHGMTSAKPRAEWIGVEARRKARLAQMARLRTEIARLDAEISEAERHLEELARRQRQLRSEADAFPTEHPLISARDALREAQLALDQAILAEERASTAYREAKRQWLDVQRAFVSATADWPALRSMEALTGAREALHAYELAVRDLRGALSSAAKARQDEETLQAEQAGLRDRWTQEQQSLADIRRQQQASQAQLDALRQILTDAGVMDLVAELEALRKTRDLGRRDVERWTDEIGSLREQRGQSERGWKAAVEALNEAVNRRRDAASRLQAEWQLGLVDPPQGWQQLAARRLDESAMASLAPAGTPTAAAESLDITDLARAAQAVVREWRSRFESRQLQQVESHLVQTFSVTSAGLRDYALEATYDDTLQRWNVWALRDRSRPLAPAGLLRQLEQMQEEQRALINEKDRELYEQILLHSVGRAIRDKIHRAEQWVAQMNRFMSQRQTSSGLQLALEWTPKPAEHEDELDTTALVQLLRKSPETLRQDEIDKMTGHFRTRIARAKELAGDGSTLRQQMTALLDYRTWFRFTLFYRKGASPRRELTDGRFNVLSGGEKAMAMYIPLLAATDSRCKDSRPTAPRIISLDEAFAGVDEQNMSDMFQLLTDMEFDYMMTSQHLWGCYETVPSVFIYEVHRPNDADFVTLFSYYWNGKTRRLLLPDGEGGMTDGRSGEGAAESAAERGRREIAAGVEPDGQ